MDTQADESAKPGVLHGPAGASHLTAIDYQDLFRLAGLAQMSFDSSADTGQTKAAGQTVIIQLAGGLMTNLAYVRRTTTAEHQNGTRSTTYFVVAHEHTPS
jgi:hypothetical protein